MVGTATNLLAFDVHNNRDIFFKDVADGVNALTIGRPNSVGPVLALAGGNCSVQGFDIHGDEKLWYALAHAVRRHVGLTPPLSSLGTGPSPETT